MRNTLTSTGASSIIINPNNNGALALSPTGITTFDVQNGTLSVTAMIINSFGISSSLTKTGPGTLALNNSNSDTGNTTINAGTLRGTGSINSTVTVVSGATLHPGVGAGGLGDQGTLSITAPSRFIFVNVDLASRIIDPELVGPSSGALLLGFTVVPVPEPAWLDLSLVLVFRRRSNREAGALPSQATTCST